MNDFGYRIYEPEYLVVGLRAVNILLYQGSGPGRAVGELEDLLTRPNQ